MIAESAIKLGCRFVNDDFASALKRRPRSPKLFLLILFLICTLPTVVLVVLLGYLMGRHEQLASFQVGPWTINVFAEGGFHYEPPGYIYFQLKEWGQTLISERRFMGIGGERKPTQRFRLVMTRDEGTIAIVLENEVQMIHEFSSGYTWPGPYTNITEPQWQIAELLLQRLRAANPEIRCTRQNWYRKELDRQRQSE
jgi:hypothetical protein